MKRQKNDAAAAEAIWEAASRPMMHFVAPKTREQQARGMLFRTNRRDIRSFFTQLERTIREEKKR